MRKIDKIIVHCSATRAGRDFCAADIRRWHVTDRGFEDIGYHYVVRIDGTVETGRPLHRIGAHTLGENLHSIGICYVGGLDVDGHPSDTRTPAQCAALDELVAALRSRFGLLPVYGHRDFAPKSCPCFDAPAAYPIEGL